MKSPLHLLRFLPALCLACLPFSVPTCALGQQAQAPVSYASVSQLNALLGNLEQADQAAIGDLSRLRIDHWKADGSTKRQTQADVQALLRNDIQLVVDFPTALHAALAEHKLRPVAATGPVSAHSLGGIPTVADAGVPGYEVASWNALYAPAGTAKEYVEILNGTLHEVLEDPDIKRRAAELGIETRGGTPDEADARMHADIAKWTKVITQANIPQQ